MSKVSFDTTFLQNISESIGEEYLKSNKNNNTGTVASTSSLSSTANKDLPLDKIDSVGKPKRIIQKYKLSYD